LTPEVTLRQFGKVIAETFWQLAWANPPAEKFGNWPGPTPLPKNLAIGPPKNKNLDVPPEFFFNFGSDVTRWWAGHVR
jgi:hypothetical protein